VWFYFISTLLILYFMRCEIDWFFTGNIYSIRI
jgi:hypothetical protein